MALQFLQEFHGEPALDRGQHPAPLPGNVDDGAPCGQRSHQPLQNAGHARDQFLRVQHPARVHAQGGKRQRVFLNCIAFVLEQNHHHGDAQQHLRNWSQQVPANALQEGAAELPKSRQYRPQRQGNGQQVERKRSFLMGVPVKLK